MRKDDTYFIPLLLIATCLCFTVSSRWVGEDGNAWEHVIEGDGRGYYAYLPAVLLYHDLSFTQVVKREQTLYSDQYAGDYLADIAGKKLNKYFPGVALLWLPFFLVAWVLSLIMGLEPNGYSVLFQCAVSTASLCYLFLGLVMLGRLLRSFNVPQPYRGAVLLLVLLGTNLFYYTVIRPGMSHVYSFALVALFLYYVRNFFTEKRSSSLLIASAALGLIILVRPVNGIVLLLVPAMSPNMESLRTSVQNTVRNAKKWAPAFLILTCIVFIAPLLWYAQIGRFFLWPYQGEGFHFDRPEIFNVLFSYRKGLFVYTPITLVSLLGLVVVFRSGKLRFASILLFIITAFYVISSWWNWYYGDSFGLRAFIDFYPVFALLLGLFIINTRKWLALTIIICCVACAALNLVQTYQYHHAIIDPNNMNKAKYWYAFLRTSDDYRGYFGHDLEVFQTPSTSDKRIAVYSNDFERDQPNWEGVNKHRIDSFAYSGSHVSKLDHTHEYGPLVTIDNTNALCGSERVEATVKGWIKPLDKPSDDSKLRFVLSITTQDGQGYYWRSLKLSDIIQPNKTGEWQNIHFVFPFPKVHSLNDRITASIWNPEGRHYYIDDLKIELITAQR